MLYFSMPKKPSIRAFKTAWFGKAAKKARIGDLALRAAILEVIQGQADDLGGGVFKKLAQAYVRMTEAELAFALSQGDLQELFHDE